jgi:hypothetical protein
MYAGKDFSEIAPDEEVVISFDVTRQLPTGVTVTSVTFSLDETTGVDSSQNNRRAGAATCSGTILSQLIQGGVAQAVYIVKALFMTSSGETLEVWARLPCNAAP